MPARMKTKGWEKPERGCHTVSMKIDERMDLTELAEHMGTENLTEAARMRDLLLTERRERTEDFSGEEWAELLIRAGETPA